MLCPSMYVRWQVKQVKRFFKKTRGFVSGFSATCLCLFLYLFKSNKLDISPAHSHGADILCVHGYLHNNTPWIFLKRRLKSAGAGLINSLTYPSITQGIAQNSLLIKEKIDEIKQATGRDVNVLIGHSLGGLISLEYALQHAPKDQILHVITLASPLHGTTIAEYALGFCCREMEINSAYLKDLHHRLSLAKNLRVLALASDVDYIVKPKESALLTEYSFAKTVLVQNLGHAAFLFSPRVIKEIIRYLREEKLLI
jgi:triacylglycerol lipase